MIGLVLPYFSLSQLLLSSDHSYKYTYSCYSLPISPLVITVQFPLAILPQQQKYSEAHGESQDVNERKKRFLSSSLKDSFRLLRSIFLFLIIHFKASTGLLLAAFQTTDAIVVSIMKIRIASGKTKCHHCSSILSENFCKYCCVR